MKLYCRLMPRNELVQNQLITRLKVLGHGPIIDTDGAVILDYEGACDGTPLAIITVFESFGCDRVFVFKDWRNDGKGQGEESQTAIKVNLGC